MTTQDMRDLVDEALFEHDANAPEIRIKEISLLSENETIVKTRDGNTFRITVQRVEKGATGIKL